MSSSTDHRWGMKEESTFGVAVTVDRFYPWLEVEPTGTTGCDTRRALPRVVAPAPCWPTACRRPLGWGMVKVKAELESKQGGVLLAPASGMSTVTAITGGSQQVFHQGLTTGYMPGHTIQVVDVTNPGADYVLTYAGCSAVRPPSNGRGRHPHHRGGVRRAVAVDGHRGRHGQLRQQQRAVRCVAGRRRASAGRSLRRPTPRWRPAPRPSRICAASARDRPQAADRRPGARRRAVAVPGGHP